MGQRFSVTERFERPASLTDIFKPYLVFCKLFAPRKFIPLNFRLYSKSLTVDISGRDLLVITLKSIHDEISFFQNVFNFQL